LQATDFLGSYLASGIKYFEYYTGTAGKIASSYFNLKSHLGYHSIPGNDGVFESSIDPSIPNKHFQEIFMSSLICNSVIGFTKKLVNFSIPVDETTLITFKAVDGNIGVTQRNAALLAGILIPNLRAEVGISLPYSHDSSILAAFSNKTWSLSDMSALVSFPVNSSIISISSGYLHPIDLGIQFDPAPMYRKILDNPTLYSGEYAQIDY